MAKTFTAAAVAATKDKLLFIIDEDVYDVTGMFADPNLRLF